MPAAALAGPHCPSGEKTVFACTTGKGKPVSVCASADTVTYRFGLKSGKPKMRIDVPRARFTYHGQGGSGGTSYLFDFTNGATRYRIDAGEMHGPPWSGGGHIQVTSKGRELARIECADVQVIDVDGFDANFRRWPDDY